MVEQRQPGMNRFNLKDTYATKFFSRDVRPFLRRPVILSVVILIA